ncbi:MAG: hypothetical protein AAF957_14715 [Planctomycetota bacterium]
MSDQEPDEDDSPALDALAGWLVLLPFAALAIPGSASPFADAPDTVSIGVAAIALAALPALALATLRGRGGDAAGLSALVVLFAFATFQTERVTDTFGAWRAVLSLAAAFGWTVAGASLGERGRAVVARGAPLVALLLLASTPFSPLWTGVLGNTGDLSEAALPGAVLGAGAFLAGSGPLAVLALLALGGFAAYAGAVPVFAGVLGLGAALGAGLVGLVATRGEARVAVARRVRLLLIAALIALVAVGARTTFTKDGAPADADADGAPASEAVEAPTVDAPTTTGGIAFRRMTWARLPAVVEDHAALGLGPGQFQAGFPPYRDPAELELTSFGRRETTPIEVEHAHSDWLTPFAEYGVLGGLAFALFLLVALYRALRHVLRAEDGTSRDFGFAAVAVLANAAVNANLLYGPLSPLIAFVVLGAVTAPIGARVRRPVQDRLGPGIALVAIALLVPRALSYLEYGEALSEVRSTRTVLEDGREKIDAVALGPILERARVARPDSPAVLEQRALLLRRTSAPLDDQRANLQAWLDIRPFSFAGLLNSGVLEARDGRFAEARDRFLRARALDAGNPGLLRNLVRLGCDRREADEVEDALKDLVERGLDDPAFLRTVAIEEMLEGRIDGVRPLVLHWTEAMDGRAVDVLDANSLAQARKRAKEAGDDALSDAFFNASCVRFGEDHLAGGTPAQAVTQFRLAYQIARDAGVDTANLRLRLAASNAAAGRVEGDRPLLGEGPLRREDYLRLTDAEREALAEAGLLSGQAALEAR